MSADDNRQYEVFNHLMNIYRVKKALARVASRWLANAVVERAAGRGNVPTAIELSRCEAILKDYRDAYDAVEMYAQKVLK